MSMDKSENVVLFQIMHLKTILPFDLLVFCLIPISPKYFPKERALV